MLLGYDHGLGVTWDGGKNWYHPDFLPLGPVLRHRFRHVLSLPRGRRPPGQRLPDGTEHEDRRYRAASAAWERPRDRPSGSRTGSTSAAATACTTSSTGRRTTRSTTNPSSARSRASTSSRASPRSIAYQRLKPETRWNWCAPILVSAHNSDTVYHCGNIVVMSTNRGETWTEISPDLSTNDPAKLTVGGKGGDGNIQYCTITTFDESPLLPGLLWAGTDDGNVWVTRDNGKAWTKLNDKIPGEPRLLGQPGRGLSVRSGDGLRQLHGLPERRLPPLPLQDDRLSAPPGPRSPPVSPKGRSTSSARTPRIPASSSPGRISACTSRSTAARPGRR